MDMNTEQHKNIVKGYIFEIPDNTWDFSNIKIKKTEVKVKENDQWNSTLFLKINGKDTEFRTIDPKFVKYMDVIGADDKSVHSYSFTELMIGYVIKTWVLPMVKNKGRNIPKSGLMIIDGPYKWHGVWLYGGKEEGTSYAKYVHFVKL